MRKDFRILVPSTPENPEGLLKYAVRVDREKDGEINIIRTITVPHQTPLSAGIAFVGSARKAFEPLEAMLNKENIVYHYLVRVSHDSTEAVLSTIAEQRISLLIVDYETIRTNKKQQTLITCDFLAVLPHSDYVIITEKQDGMDETGLAKENRKNMVVLYDHRDNSDEVLKITNWFANTGTST